MTLFPGALDNYPTNRSTATPTRLVGIDADELAGAVNALEAEVGALPRLSSYSGSATLALTDYGKVVEVTSSSSSIITVPTNAAVAFPIGTFIEVSRMGTGTVTIAAASGVTIRNPTSVLTISPQYGSVVLRKRGTNEWVINGSLA
jgi:hypothetical protein